MIPRAVTRNLERSAEKPEIGSEMYPVVFSILRCVKRLQRSIRVGIGGGLPGKKVADSGYRTGDWSI
jgi:hypothetical protein